jgi:D-serine deaminase-like pyridoxal phosphate-dependent protein
MDPYAHISRPTLILNEERARRNIHRMAEKAKANLVRFRPHFKTHQSALIGEWFRAEGVKEITVSSLGMASYFTAHGWDDITVAFPFNLREIETLWDLRQKIHLELLVESIEVVDFLEKQYPRELDLWIKIDAGANRTGIKSENISGILEVAEKISTSGHFKFRGILSHYGQTYKAGSAEEAVNFYGEANRKMKTVQSALRKAGFRKTEVSVGDTPGCSVCEDFGQVDEIRPGNFVFFDATQLRIGSCTEDDIAVAVACPVVAIHPERDEVIIYGGAVHLSKEYFLENGIPSYGDAAFPRADGWSAKIPGAYVRSLSQEHGIIHLPPKEFDKIKVGELLMILPVHSCLSVAALGEYTTLEGEKIPTMLTQLADQAEGDGSEGDNDKDQANYPNNPSVF